MISRNERNQRLAAALLKNPLLVELIEERRSEITDQWQTESDAEKRGALWTEQHALSEFGDFLYVRIRDLAETG